MIVPAVSGLGGLAVNQIGGVAQSANLNQLEGLGLGAEGLGQTGGASQSDAALGGSAGTGPSGGFSEALSGAISSLEQGQQSADGAAQALATGTSNDPESAVLTVQNAELQMQLASQMRTKATEAVQSIFQTQV